MGVVTQAQFDSKTGFSTSDNFEISDTGSLTVNDDSSILADLYVSGNITLDGNIIIRGSIVDNVSNVDETVDINVNSLEATNVVANLVTSLLFSGPLTGDVTGDVTGNVVGNLNGGVIGNVTGNVTGNLTGSVEGDVTGNLIGSVIGNVTGNLTGSVEGNVTGNLNGKIGTETPDSGSFTTIESSDLVTLDSLSVNNDANVDGTLTVTGNLVVSGTTTTVNATNLEVTDPLIYIATGNSANANDIGLVGHFNNGTYQHTGLVRDASDGKWKLFSAVTSEPSSTIDFTGATYDVLKVGGIETATISTSSNATIGGTLGVTGNTTLSALDITNSATIGGTLGVTGNTTLSGTLVVTNALTVNNSISDSKGELRLVPQNSQAGAYTLVLSDHGKHILTSSAVTVPGNVFSAGMTVVVINNSGTTIALNQGSNLTMYQVGTTNTGNRSILTHGVITIFFTDTNTCIASGGGIA